MRANEELGGGVLAPSRTLRLVLDVALQVKSSSRSTDANHAADKPSQVKSSQVKSSPSADALTSDRLQAVRKPRRVYLFSDHLLLASPRRLVAAVAAAVAAAAASAAAVRPLSARPAAASFTARHWLPLRTLAACAVEATVLLSDTRPPADADAAAGASFVLLCASAAEAAELAEAVAQAQAVHREPSTPWLRTEVALT
jgi:hypothetical protein